MEKKLSWFDRVITPKTKAYKDFENEIKNTAPEIFFRDGERKFSDQEKRFMQIYKSKESQIIQESAYTVNSIFNTHTKAPVETNFESFGELSLVMTNTQIDERQAHHVRNYEIEAKKLGTEINPLAEEFNNSKESSNQLDWQEDNFEIDDAFSQDDFYENLVSASGLPEGWVWCEYDDGSGSLKSPSGFSYYGYDIQTQEYRSPTLDNRWTNMKDFYDRSKSLNEFKTYAETDLKGKAAQNNLSPKLSEDDKNDLLYYIKFNKENGFILENLHITDEQRKSFSEKEEFGTTSGDYSLTNKQLEKIPDVLDGHFLSKADKYTLAFGFLEKQLNGESYKLLENGEILKTYLDEDCLPLFRTLTVNDIKFNTQNPNIMKTQKEFDQVKYLKDQLKYLGFGEDEKLHKDLENGINSNKQEFTIKTTSDKTLPENKVDFTLNYNRSEKGGIFLNSYDANLTNEKAESISQNFRVNRDSSFTVKESINLLEGRSVKIEFDNPKSNERESAFVKLNFGEDKNQWGNYNFQTFYKNYGVDTANIVEKSNLVFDNPEWKEGVIKSLEKGNIVKVKFKDNHQVIEGKAVLDPQNRNLKLYDNEMNRLNTNKPLEGLEQDNKHDKSNVREQSIKR